MNELLGLRTLAKVMGWDDSRATIEYEWLRLMSRYKYDGYSDFAAGARFTENLITWLQQFSQGLDRETAFNYVKTSLIYVTTSEMRKLVELFYRTHVEPELIVAAANLHGVSPYEIWANREATRTFEIMRRRTLFMALSDGARLDVLRHANDGILVHEQLVGYTQIDSAKWTDLRDKLKSDELIKGQHSTFVSLYVLDDLVASGTTLLRRDPDTSKFDGKLIKLRKSLSAAEGTASSLFDSGWTLHVHHYIGNEVAIDLIQQRAVEASKELQPKEWFPSVRFSYGMVIPKATALDSLRDREMKGLTDRYYNPAIENPKHLKQSGVADLKLGYAGSALPLVLDHNTPNNSLAILWAESDGTGAHAMRPLFRRRQRHN